MGIPDHLTCLLRNLYAGQEVTVRTEDGTKDWFQIGKGVCQGCILSPCLLNSYAEFSSVQFSRSVVSDSLRPHELQHARLPCPLPTPGVHSDSRPSSRMPSSHLILCHPLLLLPPIPQQQSLFQRVNSSHEVAKVLEFQL